MGFFFCVCVCAKLSLNFLTAVMTLDLEHEPKSALKHFTHIMPTVVDGKLC